MGGGTGISVHGQFRVATDKTMFAMPETGIGLLPDVGATYWLAKLPDGVGAYLGLTGQRMFAPDLLWLGLATHYCPSADLPSLASAVTAALDATGDAARHPAPPKGALVEPHAAAIARCFGSGADTVEGVVAALEHEAASGAGPDAEWARAAADVLATRSPTSLKVTLRAINEAKGAASVDECLQREFRIVQRFMRPGCDFHEGIRALLIDKDGKPAWNPPSLGDLSEQQVDEYFATLGEHELDLVARK